MNVTFTSAQAITLTGMSKDMVHSLCRVGLVTPRGRNWHGRRHGIARRYTFADLVTFKVVRKLCKSGASLLKVRHAIRELHMFGMSLSKLPADRVVIFERSIYKWDAKGDPFRLSDSRQAFGFILNLEAIGKEEAA